MRSLSVHRYWARINRSVAKLPRWSQAVSDGIRRERDRQRKITVLQAREEEREIAAQHIDPETCHRWFEYVDILDPYGDDPDPDRETNYGRHYFVSDPSPGTPMVSEHVLRSLHRETSDYEWRKLMAAAENRWYDSFLPGERPIDPLSPRFADMVRASSKVPSMKMPKFNPGAWDGDPEDLPIDGLLDSPDLCDETFASKHEACVAGFWHGQRVAGGGPMRRDDADRKQPTSAICGRPIENRSRALPEVTAWELIDGTGIPETIEYTGRVAHRSCVAREELARSPGDARD